MANKKAPAKGIESLSEKDLAGLQEVKVDINLRGIVNAFKYVTYKKPFEIYHGIARRVEGASKKMMVGNASLIGMPVGIVLRNTARSAYNISDREGRTRYSWIGNTAGGLAAMAAVGAATVFGGPIVAGMIGTGALVTGIGYAATAAVSGILLPRPVFTAGNLAVSTALSAVVAGVSTVIAAPANLLVGYRRSKAAFKGYKMTEDQLAKQLAEFDRYSPTARYEAEAADDVRSGLSRLPHEKKFEFYTKLKEEFEGAAQPKQDAPKPANKPQQGPQGPSQG